MYHF